MHMEQRGITLMKLTAEAIKTRKSKKGKHQHFYGPYFGIDDCLNF